jgi:hypothetical protein
MRPAGNLAGVSFIDAPLWHARRDTWREIISNSGYFFTADAMRFFECRVAWDSLTPVGEAWLFITSERAPMGERRYTVRTWTPSGVDTLGEFGEHATRAAAHRELNTRFAAADVTARLAASGMVNA